MLCPVIGLISCGVAPASDSRVTAVPRRSWKVSPSMPAKIVIAFFLSGLALALGTVAEEAVVLDAAAAPPQVEAGVPSSESESDFGILPGRWVRPDGGYVITIKSVDATGKLDAAYANPSPLPFAKAEAIRDGKSLKLFFELRAGGSPQPNGTSTPPTCFEYTQLDPS